MIRVTGFPKPEYPWQLCLNLDPSRQNYRRATKLFRADYPSARKPGGEP